MLDNVISYIEMCQREALSLQAGMNYGVGGNHSVILMSVRRNAPYRDRIEDGGTTLIYEGHDQPRGRTCQIPRPSTNSIFFRRERCHKMADSIAPGRNSMRVASGQSEFAFTRDQTRNLELQRNLPPG
jgi:hypothetical protein